MYSKTKVRQLFGNSRAEKLDIIFSRRGLSSEKRLLCTVACLQALGDTRNLKRILELAVRETDDYRAVYEVLLQGYLFCGYPRAIESFFCLDDIAKKNRIAIPRTIVSEPSSKVLSDKGLMTAGKVYRDNFNRINNKISALSPDLGYLMIIEGYGRILSRPGLEIGHRELAAVSSLSAMRAYRQLNSHIRGSINVGCHPREIFEAILCALPWLGAVSIEKSIALWSEIVGRPVPTEAIESLALRV